MVTKPDSPKGRHLRLSSTPVRELAIRNNLNVSQPQKVNSAESVQFLKSLNPDLFVVVAYGQILSRQVLEIPRIFSINIHASLLPRYRGAAPLNWALINGETQTGITIMKMQEGLDTGPIIMQRSAGIDQDDNCRTLEEKLCRLGPPLLLEALRKIKGNKFSLIPQDESKGVSFAPKLKKEDGLIDWSKPASSISNLIRGCIGWPGTFTYFKGKHLKIFTARAVTFDTKKCHPGEIIDIKKDGLLIATGKDCILIEELQLEGKRRMKAEEFVAGHKICVGDKLTG